jgi:hypothetical protein
MGGELIVLPIFFLLALLGLASVSFFVYRCFDRRTRYPALFNLAISVAVALAVVKLPNSWPGVVSFFCVCFLAIWPAALLSSAFGHWRARTSRGD